MSRELVRWSEHTIRADLLNSSSVVLDAGSRGFEFSRECLKRGASVVAIDPAPDVRPPNDPRLTFLSVALVSRRFSGCTRSFALLPDSSGNANFVVDLGIKPSSGSIIQVECIDILELTKRTGVSRWNIFKMDIEGAEFEILLEWPGPIADQISVEFHEHTSAVPKDREGYFKKCLEHLGQWYVPVKHQRTIEQGLSRPYYLDSLFVLKDLA